MAFKVGVEVPDFKKLTTGFGAGIATAATAAMRETTAETLRELRGQVTSNGLGQRLANTWRDRVYPERRESMNPTGYIWSNAPEIIDSYVRGATIRPVAGSRYLWIPTKNVPPARGRVGRNGRNLRGGHMTPEEVENRFNTDFEFKKGKNGTVLAFIDVIRSLNGRTFRPSTPGRRKRGREAEPILMFVLRKTVTMPRLLDLKGPADRWTRRFETAFGRRLQNLGSR